LLIAIANVIKQPIDADSHTYTAEFTDVSGLHEGADVRLDGVRVGKVEAIQLKRVDSRSLAVVRFTLDRRFDIVSVSRLAVKYQALTGLRYMDVANAVQGGARADRVTNVPTTMTEPSFDITVLFNGLQPVLATLSPDEINTFTDNVASFLAGDGGGLGPVLDSIRKLTTFVSDRQQVIAGLVRNVAVLAEGVHGRANSLTEILDDANVPVERAMTVLDEFRKTSIYQTLPSVITRLLTSIGVKPGIDPDKAFDKAFTNVYDFLDALKRVPAIWENISPPAQAGAPVPCSRGRAELPLPMDVLLNGRKVVLCNR
jgi:phospholipid/cholesterol/gamma-HCH transport system substrate-binding protein